MKRILVLSLLTLSGLASAYTLDYSCGEVKRVSNGKILNRLEPNLFGLNPKFVLKTKFIQGESYIETGYSFGRYNAVSQKQLNNEAVYTRFSLKPKFKKLKAKIKSDLKKAKRKDIPLYACVGRIDISFKYSGAHVYTSFESMEDAQKKMRKQAKRHL